MKRRSLILISLFMLVLFQIPQTHAAYLDESPQSITSFSETLPNDVLFYPDALTFLAGDGNTTGASGGSYVSTQVSDGTNWYVEATITGSTYNSTFHLEFEPLIGEAPQTFLYVEYFFSRTDGTGTFDDGGIQVYNHTTDSWIYLFNDVDWHGSEVLRMLSINGSGCVDSQGVLTLRATLELTDGGGGTDFGLYLDFFQIETMTLSDSDHYAESFSDVSDWVSGQGTATTDGDVMSLHVPNDASYDNYVCDEISLPIGSYFVELRYGANVSDSGGYFRTYAYSGDGATGDSLTIFGAYYPSSNWGTIKAYISTTFVIESMKVRAITGGDDVAFMYDYLRISPANETGWQHDGSTTEGVSVLSNAAYTYGAITSDDDVVSVFVNRTSGSGNSWAGLKIVYDTTTTVSDLAGTFYPFMEINWQSTDSTADALYTSVYADSKVATTDTHSSSFSWTTDRINWWAGSAQALKEIRINIRTDAVGECATIEFNFTKIYSVANWTVYQSGCETDDFFYVDSEVMYSELDSNGEYLRLAFEPSISVDTNVHTLLNITSSGYQLTDMKVDIGGQYYPLSQTSDTSVILRDGTLTQIVYWYFYDSASWSDIKFIDVRDWREYQEVDFVIPVGWSAEIMFGYDAFFIFLGLIMIVASTMYLARGGKDELSSDKFFYFLILFVMGWALFLGGIMP